MVGMVALPETCSFLLLVSLPIWQEGRTASAAFRPLYLLSRPRAAGAAEVPHHLHQLPLRKDPLRLGASVARSAYSFADSSTRTPATATSRDSVFTSRSPWRSS